MLTEKDQDTLTILTRRLMLSVTALAAAASWFLALGRVKS